MKTIKSSLQVLMCGLFLFALSTSCESQTIVTEKELPASAKTYITKHFTGVTIKQITKDRDDFTVEYDVILSDFTQLEFTSKGNIKSIKSRHPLPKTALPASVVNYVQENFPTNIINEWKLDDGRQKVELDNGVELEFDKNGNFLRIDD